MKWSGDPQVRGTLARVGSRVIQPAAKLIIGQFFKCLEQDRRQHRNTRPEPNLNHGPSDCSRLGAGERMRMSEPDTITMTVNGERAHRDGRAADAAGSPAPR